MSAVSNQISALGLPAPGFPQRSTSLGVLGLVNYGLQDASFAAKKNGTFLVPTGGTISLPEPTGSGAFIALSMFGTGFSTLSGTVSAGGAILSTLPVDGDQTLIICDADAVRGWV